jgi:NTP pyrophosphatase (non-canonical NTP hydrolase)
MDFNEYQARAMSKARAPVQEGFVTQAVEERELMIACLGLAGEAGEVCELYKKEFDQGRETPEGAVLSELGDALWYLTRLATLEGYSLAEVAEANIAKLDRRYPKGFVPGGGIR